MTTTKRSISFERTSPELVNVQLLNTVKPNNEKKRNKQTKHPIKDNHWKFSLWFSSVSELPTFYYQVSRIYVVCEQYVGRNFSVLCKLLVINLDTEMFHKSTFLKKKSGAIMSDFLETCLSYTGNLAGHASCERTWEQRLFFHNCTELWENFRFVHFAYLFHLFYVWQTVIANVWICWHNPQQ